MSRAAFWPWLRPFLILVCVVATPLVVYFFGYVQHSVATHRQRSFVTLTAVAAELGTRLKAYDNIAERASYVAEESDKDENARLKSYLGAIVQAKRFVVPTAEEKAKSTATHNHLDLDTNGAGLGLHVGCAKVEDKPCASPRTVLLTTFVPLENLVAWDMVQTDFDGVLVLDEHGQLVAQDRRLPAQPLAVPVKLSLGGNGFNVGAFFGSTRSDEKAKNSSGDSAQEQSADVLDAEALRSPLSFRDEVVLQIAGVDYVAFLQPLRVPVTAVGGGEAQPEKRSLDMVVCGLVRQDRMRSEALALSPATLVIVSAIVAFGLFAIPFLKLRFIGPRERMRRRDVWLLACTALCVTALGTLLALERHTVGVLQDRFDEGLRSFADTVATKASEERRLAIDQLYASGQELLRSGDGSGGKRGIAAVLTKENREFNYPAFEALYAVELDRKQTIKWMPRTVLTAMVSVQIDIADALSLGLSRDPSASNAEEAKSASFQTNVATTTGLLLGTFAVPAAGKSAKLGPDVELNQRDKVVILATPYASLNEPLVAPPFQFVLVDRPTGKIAMKSAAGPFRDERFFESVHDGVSLQRTAQLEAGGDVRAFGQSRPVGSYSYRGTKYRMRAVELPDLHATLVTYYEQNIVESLGARMMVGGALFALVIVISVLIGGCIAYGWLRERAFDWAWPSPVLTSHYLFGILACWLIGATVLIAYCWLAALVAPWVFAVFLLSMPGVAVIAVSLLTRSCKPTPFRLRMQRVADWLSAHAGADAWMFTAFAVVALLTFVALPTMLVYDDVATLYRAAYNDTLSATFAGDEAKRLQQLRSGVVLDDATAQETTCGDNSGVKIKDARCAMPERERVYASRNNYSRLVDLQRKLGIYDNCIDAAPNQSCSLRDANGVVPWSFTLGALQHLPTLGGDTQSAITLTDLSRKEAALRRSHAVFAGFSFSVWNAGGFVVMIVGLGLLVRSIATNVLGLGLVGDGVLPREHDFKPADATRWLLLRPSVPDVQAALRGRQSIATFDLRDYALKSGDLQGDGGAGSALLIKHVESRLTDRDWRNSILQMLATPRTGCLVLISEIDPLHFLAQRLRETVALVNSLGEKDVAKRELVDAECTKLGDELVRWAIALRGVEKIRRAPFGFSTDVQSNVSVELCEKIAAECQWSEPLIHIGARLVARSDLATYRWSQIVDFIRDAAEPFYRSQWALCSRDEKLIMLQLAEEGVVNPKSIDLVMRLARRRLVVVDPRFRIMNESFCEFVRTAELPEHIVQWEHAGSGTTWSRLQTPIYALAIVILAILLYTEQGLASSIVAIATGAAGKLGSLRKLYAALNPTSSQLVA